jgi:hypothetical protein
MIIHTYFDPVAEYLWQKKYSESSFFKQIHFFGEDFPDLRGVQIALVGLKENRGALKIESAARGSTEIREKLYELKRGLGSYRIADLGDLITGDTREQTYELMQIVGEYLMKNQILPIYLGGSNHLLAAMIRRKNLELVIGPPIMVNGIDESDDRKRDYGIISSMVLEEIRMLKGE